MIPFQPLIAITSSATKSGRVSANFWITDLLEAIAAEFLKSKQYQVLPFP